MLGKTQQFGECGVPSHSGETWARSGRKSVCRELSLLLYDSSEQTFSPCPMPDPSTSHFRTVPEFIRATSQTALELGLVKET